STSSTWTASLLGAWIASSTGSPSGSNAKRRKAEGGRRRSSASRLPPSALRRTRPLHHPLPGRQKTGATVEVVGVAGMEEPANAGEIGMGDQGFDEPETETVPPMLRQNENVGEVGGRGEVGDDPGATDLLVPRVEPDHHRGVVPGTADRRLRPPL